MPINPAICDAIASMRIVEFDYTDARGNQHHRVVEPYAHGRTAQGQDALRGYQIGGTSEAGEIPAWRLFLVDRMVNLRVMNTPFSGDAPGYARGESVLSSIYCMVE